MNNYSMVDYQTGMPSEHDLMMEVFTAFHRIQGKVTTSVWRTNGVLNSIGDFLMVEGVTTQSLVRPLEPPIESRIARINKQSLVLAVPNEEAENDRLRQRTRLSGYLLQRRVLINLGNFEISGNLHLETELEIGNVLLNRQEQFIGMTETNIVYLLNPGLRFNASTVLINKSFVSFICTGAP